MSCNPKISELDPPQIVRRTFDCEHDATRVVFAHDHETAIEVRAEDGDSVLTLPMSMVITDDQVYDVSGVKNLCLYTDGAATVQISPSDSDNVWLNILSHTAAAPGTMEKSAILPICARRIRIYASVGSVYLVCQS